MSASSASFACGFWVLLICNCFSSLWSRSSPGRLMTPNETIEIAMRVRDVSRRRFMMYSRTDMAIPPCAQMASAPPVLPQRQRKEGVSSFLESDPRIKNRERNVGDGNADDGECVNDQKHASRQVHV